MRTLSSRRSLSWILSVSLLCPCFLLLAEEKAQDKFEHYTPQARAYAHECFEKFIELNNHLENGSHFEEAIFVVYDYTGFLKQNIKVRINKSKKEELDSLRQLEHTVRLRLPIPNAAFGSDPQICALKITYGKREFWLYATKHSFTTSSSVGGTSRMHGYESPALAAIFEKYYKEATGEHLDPEIVSAWSGKYQFDAKPEDK